MLEVAVIGGGLCGLSLTNRLHSTRRDVHLFEARAKLGGRISSVFEPINGIAADLGASWFWPHAQPLIGGLIAELSLDAIPQYDTGKVLVLSDTQHGPMVHGTGPVHGGGLRIAGGTGKIIDGLASRLPHDAISTGHVLAALEDRGDHVSLTFKTGEDAIQVDAEQVVLAVPPRLLAEYVAFAPALPPEIAQALDVSETWMAGQAKAVMTFTQASWRDEGFSGSAFVTRDIAVLGEVFDLSSENGRPGALGGFVALSPEARAFAADRLPTLIAGQLADLFGAAAQDGVVLFKDWASEPFTCSTRDRIMPSQGRYTEGHPLLRRPYWGSKLHFAGSETASAHAGHMEGALHAAERLAQLLCGPLTSDALEGTASRTPN